MKELIDHIPFLDTIIVSLLVFFLYVGWKHGLPRLVMTEGALYTGFLLASIYYHLFAVTIARAFNTKPSFLIDMVGFLVLNVMVTLLMMALLFSLFGHIAIKGRWEVFNKVGGTLSGFFVGIIILSVSITILRIPHEASKQRFDPNDGIPAVTLFNQGFERSALAPLFFQGAPFLVASTGPMLPPETRAKGVVPLFESVVSRKP